LMAIAWLRPLTSPEPGTVASGEHRAQRATCRCLP
jgi:hypothetical protein